MTDVTILHNPRCSKSRQTLDLLTQRGVSPDVVHYLETPPDMAGLKAILAMGQWTARDLLRKGEDEYKTLGLDNPALSDDELVAAMAAHPRLIERPIVIRGKRACLGRPPEAVLTLLDS